jgi:hypothetical protein
MIVPKVHCLSRDIAHGSLPTLSGIDPRGENAVARTSYTRDGDAPCSVHRFMIHKRTGGTTYAVHSLGGILGIGKSYYPLHSRCFRTTMPRMVMS